MGDYKPLLTVLVIQSLVLFMFLPFVTTITPDLVDEQEIPVYYQFFIGLFTEGFSITFGSIFGFDISLTIPTHVFFPGFIQDFLVQSILAVSLIPTPIVISWTVISTVASTYAIIKVLPFT